jgi:hypothetical protein
LWGTVCAPEPIAWRLHIRGLDRELWVVGDAEGAAALDRDGVRQGLPVVWAADVEYLLGLDHRWLHDLLDGLAVFPGARLVSLNAGVPT